MSDRKQPLLVAIQALETVESASNFPFEELPDDGLTLLPFLCPFRYKPFSIVRDESGSILGVSTGYRKGITRGSQSKIDRVSAFWEEAANLLAGSRIRFLMGDSDVYACCTIYPEAPPLAKLDDFEIVSNKQVWEENGSIRELEDIAENLYDRYSAGLKEVIDYERREHLRVDEGMYHEDVPEEWKEAMIRRILSSYMLDGLLMRRGVYGPNPVILGVEASSTAILQNAALDEKIPVIMLRA